MKLPFKSNIMIEIGIAEYFSMGGALGIISSMFVVLYFSRKQMKILSADIETKILNDMDERMREITQMAVGQPELIKVLSNVPANYSSPEVAFAYYILYTFAHVFHMWQRGVLNDSEWTRWLRFMKSAYEQGTIAEIWKTVDAGKWLDPAFEEFINKELARK
ncbi:MAG: hypothetical protein ACRD7F_00800 [Nitrososphaeraceae archaeon]